MSNICYIVSLNKFKATFLESTYQKEEEKHVNRDEDGKGSKVH